MFRTVRYASALIASALILVCACASADTMLQRKLIGRSGAGYLEQVGTQLVLHLKGTPQEMGKQHGTLLKDHIRRNIQTLEDKANGYLGDKALAGRLAFATVWQQQLKYMPDRYVLEIEALAKAVGLPFETVRDANTIPEFFHCSGFALFGSATRSGSLYHGRILDYGVDMGLQDHAVVIIAQPKGHNAFVNVGYAGFVGSVTGMNLKGIGFGEMGGGGVGKWDGLPMSFLMRRGLEEASTLAEATAIFQNTKRTCEYYYVISDANALDAVGVAATPEEITFVGPNEAKGPLTELIKDAVVLSAGDRYQLLVKRIREKLGTLDPAACIELMKRPVSMTSNLHTALMAPKTGEIWVAHASHDGQPASEQTYTYLSIRDLMAKEPGM